MSTYHIKVFFFFLFFVSSALCLFHIWAHYSDPSMAETKNRKKGGSCPKRANERGLNVIQSG